eukprot:PITA_25256
MKKDVTDYLAQCIECQQVKAEHQHPVGLLQPLPVPEWKWEVITMDFITGLPKSKKSNDSIMVVVDKLTFWRTLFEVLGTQLNFSTAYHPQTDGQIERMSPFEVLYGRKCRTPSSWGGPEDKLVLGPEMLKEMEEMVKRVRANLKVAQYRQKHYADQKKNFKEF